MKRRRTTIELTQHEQQTEATQNQQLIAEIAAIDCHCHNPEPSCIPCTVRNAIQNPNNHTNHIADRHAHTRTELADTQTENRRLREVIAGMEIELTDLTKELAAVELEPSIAAIKRSSEPLLTLNEIVDLTGLDPDEARLQLERLTRTGDLYRHVKPVARKTAEGTEFDAKAAWGINTRPEPQAGDPFGVEKAMDPDIADMLGCAVAEQLNDDDGDVELELESVDGDLVEVVEEAADEPVNA